jgi:hypothetical protein
MHRDGLISIEIRGLSPIGARLRSLPRVRAGRIAAPRPQNPTCRLLASGSGKPGGRLRWVSQTLVCLCCCIGAVEPG